MRIFLFSVLATILFHSCEESTRVLPRSWGDLDEVTFIEDARYHSDSIYKLTDEKLRMQRGSYVQTQFAFSVLYKKYEDFDDHWSYHRNIIFVGVLDQESQYNETIKSLLGAEGVAKVMEGGFFRVERKAVWSSGQTVHILVASDYQSMEAGLSKGLDRVVESIEATEFEKIRSFVYSSGINVDLTQELENEHNINMKIPATYRKHAKSNNNFHWYRKSTIDQTATVMLLEQPYTRSVQVTPDYAIFIRDSLGKRYERSQIEGAYMTTEKRIRPQIDTLSVNGHFAIRTQGLWRLVGDFMGGAYVNYLVYDEDNQRVIYLDAYVHAPDIKNKRKMMREHEAIITTFSVPKKDEVLN
ncbi:MAG: hypothetical protein ACI959_002069 [Limisphaerales bacterium]|jgi:hypothetical protein